jgi:hypothetical protein
MVGNVARFVSDIVVTSIAPEALFDAERACLLVLTRIGERNIFCTIMDNPQKIAGVGIADLEEKKECVWASVKAIEVEITEPRKDATAYRPLVRRQYAASIPLNDPNNVF